MKHSATSHLHKIAVSAKDLEHSGTILQGWKRIFGDVPNMEVQRKIGLLYSLIDAAAQEVLEVDPEQLGAVNHWRSQLYAGLSVTSSKSWNEFRANIDSHTINYLKIQSSLVHVTIPEEEVDYEDLMKARALLLEAIEEIRASEISSEVKLRMIRKIRKIVAAIDDYKLTGNEEVFNQFKSAIYDAAASEEICKTGLGEKFAQAAEVLANIVACATGIQQLAAPTFKLISLIGK